MRTIGMAFFVGSSLVLAGCSSDNEAEADKLQAKLGPAPKSDVKAENDVPPPAGSMEEYAKRRQSAPDPYAGTGYGKSSSGPAPKSK